MNVSRNNVGVPFEIVKSELMKDKDFKKEYDKLKPVYNKIKRDIIREEGEKYEHSTS